MTHPSDNDIDCSNWKYTIRFYITIKMRKHYWIKKKKRFFHRWVFFRFRCASLLRYVVLFATTILTQSTLLTHFEAGKNLCLSFDHWVDIASHWYVRNNNRSTHLGSSEFAGVCVGPFTAMNSISYIRAAVSSNESLALERSLRLHSRIFNLIRSLFPLSFER